MNKNISSGLTVSYSDGVYEITGEALLHSPRLYFGMDPNGADRTNIGTIQDSTFLWPSPLPGNRLYFFLKQADGSVLTAAARGVEISGLDNFRDLGGYPTSDGRHVKWGRFFRGGPISGLTQEDKAALHRLGLKKVFDYRTQKEHERVPDECPERAECIWAPAAPKEKRFQDFADRDMLTHLMTVNTADDAREAFQIFKDLYAAMPFGCEAFRQMLYTLDSEETVPMYQHCSAGKDRTGVGSALLLLALGVDEQTVTEDYLLSRIFRRENNHRHVERLVSAGISKAAEDLVVRMMTGIEELIAAALEAILTKYKTYEAFFLGEYGITQEQIDCWRNMHTY